MTIDRKGFVILGTLIGCWCGLSYLGGFFTGYQKALTVNDIHPGEA